MNVVIPAEWIYDIENHFEKFINFSLNSNQWFLCYYTTKPNAFSDDHRPDENIVPDFRLNLITEINAGDEFNGVFFGRLVHCSRMY